MAATATTHQDTRQLPGARPGGAPGGSTGVRTDATDPLTLRAPRHDELLRRLRLPLAAAVALVAALLLLGAPVDPVVDVARRLLAADHAWLLAAVALEVLSFAGYVALLWAVGGRASTRFGLREAYGTTVAGAAATRLLPTAGAGGAALTLWLLRRSGARDAARTLATFLAVLYGVFLLGVLGAGVAVSVAGRPEIGALPAALAAAAIAVALLLGRGAARRAPTPPPTRLFPTGAARATTLRIEAGGDALRPGSHGVGARLSARLRDALADARRGAGSLGPGIADAGALVRGTRDPRLLGAVAWWGADIAVLGAAVHAVGGSVAVGTLVLAYLLGQVANIVPLPGAASSGLVGVLILLGTGAGTAVAAVLCYRVIAIWLPAPAGVAAMVRLRRTVVRWRSADAAQGPRALAGCAAHAPQPLAG